MAANKTRSEVIAVIPPAASKAGCLAAGTIASSSPQEPLTPVAPPKPTDDPNAPPALYTAIQEQLGLKMGPGKAPDDVIVIDQAEKPSAN